MGGEGLVERVEGDPSDGRGAPRTCPTVAEDGMVSTPWGRRGRERRGDAPGGPVLVHPNAPPGRRWVHAVLLSSSPSRWSATGVSRERPPRQKVPRARQLRVRDHVHGKAPRALLGRHRAGARAIRRVSATVVVRRETTTRSFRLQVSGTRRKRKQTASSRERAAPTRNARRVAVFFLQSHENAATADRVATRGFTFSRERAPALSPPHPLLFYPFMRAALRTARSP